MITRSLKEEKRQEIDVPQCVCIYIFSRHLFSYPFTHLHIRKNILYTPIIFDCNIYITHDGWKEHLSAVFNNIVLVLSYRSFTLERKKRKKRTHVDMFFFRIFFPLCDSEKNHPDRFNG